jgi:dihydropteroate synthase
MTPTRTHELKCRDKTITLGARTLIMGILNITPDSFSDGGQYIQLEDAVSRARQMVAEGADILDIGGESTRPGHEPVSKEEELRRVIPVIEAISREVDIPISIDTYKAEVADQALKAGAQIINDVWGFKEDPEMAEVAARHGCPVILMHNRKSESYGDFLADVNMDLQESIHIAKRAGVEDSQIILDPGIGFAKSHNQNLYLMNHLSSIATLGYPILLGTSRKRVIRNTLDLPADDVVEGTAATVALGIAQGVSIIRVHDVKPMKRIAVMSDAIVRATLD